MVRDMRELGIVITTYTYPDDVEESVLLHHVPEAKQIAIRTGIIISMLYKNVGNLEWDKRWYLQHNKGLADSLGCRERDVNVFKNFDHAMNFRRFGSRCQSLRRSVNSAVFHLRGESGLIPRVFSYISSHVI